MEKKTRVMKIDADWKEVKNECRNTANKQATGEDASREFIRKILISEHSPIRLVRVKWRWERIKSWVSVHFARHWLGWEKWVSTQRTDRTGIDRDRLPQDALVDMDISANAQALINVSRYRLCRQAAPETRRYMEDLKAALCDEGQKELSDVMVPNCVYRCGCPEFHGCGYFEGFYQWVCGEYGNGINVLDIQERYEAYSRYFRNVQWHGEQEEEAK